MTTRVSIQTVQDERRFDKGAWLTLLVLLAWFVPIAGMGAALGYPSDGWANIRQNKVGGASAYRYDNPLGPDAAPLHAGDVVVAVNGQPLSAQDAPPLPANLQAGQRLLYTVQRATGDGSTETRDIEIQLVSVGLRGFWYGWLSRLQATPRDMIVSLLSFLVAAFAFIKRPGNLGARYLFLFFGFYFVVEMFGFASNELYRFTYPAAISILLNFIPTSWFWFFFPTLALVALSFPVVKAPLRRFPRLLPALFYGIPGATAAISVVFGYAERSYAMGNRLLPVFVVSTILSVVALLASLIHNWITLREPVARLQLRWVALGLGGGLGTNFTLMIILALTQGDFAALDNVLWLWLLVPICLTIAILRYRLFDIDVIIRRTLVFAILTAVLAIVYFGAVVLSQHVLRALTGQTSDLAIVISTLAVAALFAPLRGRIQTIIDRRLYRRKYDANQALAQFSISARDETDLARLSERLLAIVNETLQPEHSALWMSNPTATKRVQR